MEKDDEIAEVKAENEALNKVQEIMNDIPDHNNTAVLLQIYGRKNRDYLLGKNFVKTIKIKKLKSWAFMFNDAYLKVNVFVVFFEGRLLISDFVGESTDPNEFSYVISTE